MNLNEAKQILKRQGYRLIKEAASYDSYVLYKLYGDRPHSNPESAAIYLVTTDPVKVVDDLMDIAKMGPDDIFYFGVARVSPEEASFYEEIKAKGDVAENGDTEAVNAILKLSQEGRNVEYNGDAIMEICGYPDDYDDPALDDLLYDEFKNDVDNL